MVIEVGPCDAACQAHLRQCWKLSQEHGDLLVEVAKKDDEVARLFRVSKPLLMASSRWVSTPLVFADGGGSATCSAVLRWVERGHGT